MAATRTYPGRTRLDPQARHEQILAAAETVLRDRTPSDLTFDAVAETAGVSRALVYNYFGDRSGLLAAVELRALGRLNDHLHACLDASRLPAEQLRPLATAYEQFAREHGVTWRALAAAGSQHPSLEAARRVRVERLAALWGGTVEAAVAAHTVTSMLEAATDRPPSSTNAALDTVCRILTEGLQATMSSRGTSEAPAI